MNKITNFKNKIETELNKNNKYKNQIEYKTLTHDSDLV